MIEGLILATLVAAALILRAMFRSTNEGVKRLRTVLLIGLAVLGLVMLFQIFSPGEAVFVLAITGVIIWVVKGFRKG